MDELTKLRKNLEDLGMNDPKLEPTGGYINPLYRGIPRNNLCICASGKKK